MPLFSRNRSKKQGRAHVAGVPSASELAEIGRRAYGAGATGPSPDLVDPPVVAVLQANGFPMPGTPEHAQLTEQLLERIAVVAGDDDWAQIGALLVAKNFLSADGETSPVYLEIMSRAIDALKQCGVNPGVLPPYIMRHWTTN